MTFFESELRKIIGEEYSPIFVDRACYIQLSEQNRAKIEFIDRNSDNHYDAIHYYDGLQMSTINLTYGKIDTLRLSFLDVLGNYKVNNPNFPNGVSPHLRTYNGKTDWYVCKPTQNDYLKLREYVLNFLNVFRTPEKTYDDKAITTQSLDAVISSAEKKAASQNSPVENEYKHIR